MRGKIKKILFALLCFLVFAGVDSCDSESSQPSIVNNMLDAFSQGCNMGSWTKAALDRSTSITSIYKSLLKNAHCENNANLQKALIASENIENELRAIDADSAFKQERTTAEASNDLLLALQQPGLDPDIKTSLISYYTSARYNQSVAKAEADYIRHPGYKDLVTNGLTRINSHVRDLLTASKELGECYANNPSVAISIGASLSELAGSFAPPLIGLGLTSLSDLMKLGIEAARTMPISNAIYETRKDRFPTALSCGLEALSRDYCKARDARILLTVATKKDDHEPLPFFAGVELQDRQLPKLYAWLDRVVNGSDNMQDPDQANKINLQFSRIATSQAMKRSDQGLTTQTLHDMKKAITPESQVDLIKKLLRNLIGVYFSCYPADANGDLQACPTGIYYQLETPLSFVKKITNNFLDAKGANDFIDKISLQPSDINAIIERDNNLFTSRYVDVVRDFNDKVNVDLPSLVRDASRIDKEELSPILAIEKLFNFFNNYAFETDTNGQRDRIIIDQIREKIAAVYNTLSDPNSVSDIPQEIPCVDPTKNKEQKKCYDLSPAAKVIALTYDTFKLDKNNVFLPGVLSGLVETDLTTRYLRGEGPREIDDLYRLATTDLNLLLQRSNLTPMQVLDDINTGQSITMGSLRQFRDFFNAYLAQSMADKKQSANDAKEPSAGDPKAPNRNVLSKLCILTLISGMEWPNTIDKNLCHGTKLFSQEANLYLDFDELDHKLANQAFDDRICTYEEFLRADRLANLNLKKPGEKNKKPRRNSIDPYTQNLWQRYLNFL